MFLALSALSALLTLIAFWLPNRSAARPDEPMLRRLSLGRTEAALLLSMALFTFGSLAIWPFMERAAHAIGISAVEFGRFQSIATLASALGNVILAAIVGRIRYEAALAGALLVCGLSCAALTTVSTPGLFGVALIAYNVSWFVSYPLLLGIAYRVDEKGSLPVLCSAVWLLMTSAGSLTTGFIAQAMGGYGPVGPLGLAFCLLAIAFAVPLARRVARAEATASSGVLSTAG